MYRPLVQPKFYHSRGQQLGPGLHVLATGGLKTGQSSPVNLGELAAFLQAEGWDASVVDGQLRVQYNGTTYWFTQLQLRTCDFTGIPGGLANDIREGLQAQGICL